MFHGASSGSCCRAGGRIPCKGSVVLVVHGLSAAPLRRSLGLQGRRCCLCSMEDMGHWAGELARGCFRSCLSSLGCRAGGAGGRSHLCLALPCSVLSLSVSVAGTGGSGAALPCSVLPLTASPLLGRVVQVQPCPRTAAAAPGRALSLARVPRSCALAHGSRGPSAAGRSCG